MNTDIHNRVDEMESHNSMSRVSMDLSSVYPAPANLSLSQLFIRALFKNVPVFLITLGLIMLLA